MTTVIDVARHAGVSSATVSRVLNGNATVSTDMRNRVQSAVKVLEFHPNPMAQGLRKGQTNTVALLVGDIAQTHFSELTMQVQVALEAIGIDLLLFNLGHSANRLAEFLVRAISMRLRGVAIALSDTVPRSSGQLFADLQAHDITVIAVGQNLTRYGVPSIVHEERAATHRAVTYLLEQGHRRVAYVGRIKGSAVGTERYRGYRAALAQRGVFSEELVWDIAYRYAAGRNAVLRAIDAGIGFTALQAGSDEIAVGAIGALQDRGLRVPDDVAIIGFGDVQMGSYLRPSLTTLSSHPELAASHIGSLLMARDSRSTPALTLLQRNLVRRGSA